MKNNLTDQRKKIQKAKQYQKGIAVCFLLLVIALCSSGCTQAKETDTGVALYDKAAEYLPEDAIHNPDVYEMHEDVDGESIAYWWMEERYTVAEEEAAQADLLIGIRGSERLEDGTTEYYRYKRSLMIGVFKETGEITFLLYANNEDKPDSVKPAEIGRDKEKRDAYVQKISADLIAGRENLTFVEWKTETDEAGNEIRGYYRCGTEADAKQYILVLDYIEGCLLLSTCMDYIGEDMQTVEIWKDEPIMLEGMEETVRLYLNRQTGYYTMYTDPTMFDTYLNGIREDSSFCDEYVYTAGAGDSLIQTYMRVGFVPDMTAEKWLEVIKQDSDYEKFLPQINPLSSASHATWETTGNTKIFPSMPERQWQEFVAFGMGVTNICYVTPYRNGLMIAQLSFPSGSEYDEGIATRMQQMLDTLVLATE